jgi:hypothetical protein
VGSQTLAPARHSQGDREDQRRRRSPPSAAGSGPAPGGLVLPSSETTVEVEAVSGKVLRLSPEFPVPFFHAWGYRLARRLDLPLASTLDPEDLSFELPVPRWVWRGLPPQKAGQPGRELDATPNVSPSSEWRP